MYEINRGVLFAPRQPNGPDKQHAGPIVRAKARAARPALRALRSALAVGAGRRTKLHPTAERGR